MAEAHPGVREHAVTYALLQVAAQLFELNSTLKERP